MVISKRQTKPPVLFFPSHFATHRITIWLVGSRPSAHPPPPLFSKDLSPSQDLFRLHTRSTKKKKKRVHPGFGLQQHYLQHLDLTD